MTSRRRSSRGTKSAKKYQEFDSDDEDGCLAALDSGSDFENDLKKQNNNLKNPKMSSSSSEGEVEEEDEIPTPSPSPPPPQKNKEKLKSLVPNKTKLLMKQREKLLEGKPKKKNVSAKPSSSLAILPSSSMNSLSKSLALSESSDSDSEPENTNVKKFSKKKTPKQKAIVTERVKSESESDEEMVDFSSQLECLASQQSQTVQAKTSPKKSPMKSSSLLKPDSLNIKDLLAQAGEGVSLSDSDNDENTEDNEGVKKDEVTSEVKQETISIELPHEDGIRKRKKKGFDMEAWVRRELGRAQRELQMLKHQAHVACLLAHLRYLNSFAAFPPENHDSAEMLIGIALSIIPSAHNVHSKDLTLVRLSSYVSWFCSAFQVLKEPESKFPSPLEDWLMRAMENFICTSPVQRVLIFLLTARAMGWPARLVLNFDVISFKPEKSLGSSKLADILNGKEIKEEEQKTDDINKPSTSKKDDKSKAKSTTKRTHIKEDIDEDSEKPKKSSKSSKQSGDLKSKGRKRKDLKTEEISDESDDEQSKEKCARKNESKGSSRSSKSVATSSSKRSSSSRSKSKVKDDENDNNDDISRKSSSRSSKTSSSASKRTSSSRSKSTMKDDKDESDDDKSRKSNNNKKNEKSSRPSRKSNESQSKKVKLSDSAISEAKHRSNQKTPAKKSTSIFNRTNSDSDSDYFEKAKSPKRKVPQPKAKETKSKPIKKAEKPKGVPYWLEIYVHKSGWITVDVDQGRTNCPLELEERCAIKPMLYVVAANADNSLKDVTKRYGGDKYDTHIRKARNMTEEWFNSTIKPFERQQRKSIDDEEDKQLKNISTAAPMPTSIAAFKNHPLYALTRHLLKFEAIYPPEAPPLGFIKKEPIYARECVHILEGRVSWLKEGRIVRIGEEPYKVVKARPKWDRMSGTVTKDEPLDLFGKWQTEINIPPPAKDGKVPRNEYGNVELFKPWMLPKGTVQLHAPGLHRVARKLGIDCAQAMVGWDFSGGRAHPCFDGYVVCEEFQDTLMDAWNAENEERERKAAEKKTKRALDNWKKLIRGLAMHEKIRKKYAQQPVSAE